ncbi:tRNA epoxyqueuosine(34) reductase QueG [Thioalkalivibrio sp. XN8]|uniref:tRNA epoxyqueuosine(34) reductase QueG n=1 Tax=Thioalkalivibrio sp. XN8 TaxID=2712863 RepID=UPI0013E9E248|nr:tRNA epoxyqueuosine(34) reductase QueG [Thioalkalivibrio sp. XN8]NGP51936.1 tRNA epoxyqueuosine(34) reductase QueG [Thioalkalivibrio sp. XN8]
MTPIILPGVETLARQIKDWGRELGFGAVGIARAAVPEDEAWLKRWLALGRHGDMEWMARHGTRRSRPADLVPGTISVISVRLDYLPPEAAPAEAVLAERSLGYVSRYALGRDYHKVLRRRLQRLADRIETAVGPFGYRVFTDSAPVLEKALARDAGLGWIGKHTNLLARDAGSWFFLGEIYTDLPLPADTAPSAHCGSCTACLDACPTAAIVAPYELDARRCISYLTIEHEGAIPVALRPALGNRIYGCDDCQLVCPWNRYAQFAATRDFRARDNLDAPVLAELFAWSETDFLARMEGSAIRRIGYQRWLRNIAVALGNAAPDEQARAALAARADDASALLREHVAWALGRHERAQQR